MGGYEDERNCMFLSVSFLQRSIIILPLTILLGVSGNTTSYWGSNEHLCDYIYFLLYVWEMITFTIRCIH